MDYMDHRSLIKEADLLLENKSYEHTSEAPYKYDESLLKWLCVCGNRHHFDYRNRILYPLNDRTHAPCQGKCPICGSGRISFWSKMVFPIRWNYMGG